MNIWAILQIEPTNDTKTIRQAYAKRLLQTNPEVDPEGFQELRAAYESALNVRKIPQHVEEHQPVIRSLIPDAPEITPLPPGPVLSETAAQVQKLMDSLYGCEDERKKVALLKQWESERAFSHLGVSISFQEELLHQLEGQKRLFIAAYQLFSWDKLLEKPSHPLAQKLAGIIEDNQLDTTLSLLQQTAGFPLLQAAITGDIEAAELNFQEVDDEGNTALHIACLVQELEFVSFLLEKKIPLELEDDEGKTALTIAVELNNFELVQILCEAGADINNKSPIVIAVRNGSVELVKYLGASCDLDPMALCVAVLTHQMEMVHLLIEIGCEVSPENVPEPPLIIAARLNKFDILSYLLDQGADVHQTNKKAETALVVAAKRGFAEVVDRLLQSGAHENAVTCAALAAIESSHFSIVRMLMESFRENVHLKCLNMQMDSYGFTSYRDDLFLSMEAGSFPPFVQAIYEGKLFEHSADIDQLSSSFCYSPLFIAVKVQNRHAYQKLMELGAKDQPTVFGHTALFAAVYNNDLALVHELVERGSDLHQYAGDGFRTLIFAAVRYGYHDMLRLLLSYGLDPDRIGGDPYTPRCCNYDCLSGVAMTPLAVAVKSRDVEMINLLLQAGADPNRTSLGTPPLHFAMAGTFPASESINYYANIESSHGIIDLLLQKGADINLQSKEGYTFLAKAVHSNLLETVIHLIESGASPHIPDNQGKLPIDHAKDDLLINYLKQEMQRQAVSRIECRSS